MSRCSHDMTVMRECLYVCLAQLIVLSLFISEISASTYTRHKFTPRNTKKFIEDTTEASNPIPDQVALATNNNQRRKDYGYGNFELNLVRPEKEPRLHAQITTKYTTSIIADHTPPSSLEDSETAEEYVSKAMQRYGARLKEPIRIEPEPEIVNTGNTDIGNQNYYGKPSSTDQDNEKQQQTDFIPNQPQQGDETTVLGEAQLLLQQQLQQQQQQQQQQENFEYYQAPQSTEAKTNEQPNVATLVGQPTSNIEKELLTPSYRIYDEDSKYEGAQPIDRTYRTKFAYQPSYHTSHSDSSSNEDKIRVSASTEIPKAEIMKQIEKSVIKYMQELEAEGKIITAPKEPKTYYKLLTVPVEDKHLPSTTTRPKYSSSSKAVSYHTSHNIATSPAPYTIEKTTRYRAPTSSHRQHIYSENSGSYQPASHSQQQETLESVEPKVEFVYKIKSRTPLQTATVKTISKPYSLPLKSAPDQFDHSAVLKSMEEFDLRHVIASKENDDGSPSTSDKTRLVPSEYRKIKEPHGPTDYKGYSGYFAEPAPLQSEKEASSSSSIDDGYPIMNPYQYILKKEHPVSQFEETPSSTNWDQSHIHNKPSSKDFENYNTKYSNSPDSYGYLQSYKLDRDREPLHVTHKHSQRHVLGKRGKRGNIHHPNSSKKNTLRNNKDNNIAASLALRPPPKV